MSGTPMRQPAVRVFGREFNQMKHEFKEGEDDRSPNFALAPTGEKVNRVFIVGTVIEVEERAESDYVRARLVDLSSNNLPEGQTGAATVYLGAGQYEPEAQDALKSLETPAFVGVVGKVNSYLPEDGGDTLDDRLVNIRPESIFEVSDGERDQWVAEAVRDTLDRVENFCDAEDDKYVEMAKEKYGDDLSFYLEGVRAAIQELGDDDFGLDDVDIPSGTGDSQSGEDGDVASDDSDGSADTETSDESSDDSDTESPEEVGEELA